MIAFCFCMSSSQPTLSQSEKVVAINTTVMIKQTRVPPTIWLVIFPLQKYFRSYPEFRVSSTIINTNPHSSPPSTILPEVANLLFNEGKVFIHFFSAIYQVPVTVEPLNHLH